MEAFDTYFSTRAVIKCRFGKTKKEARPACAAAAAAASLRGENRSPGKRRRRRGNGDDDGGNSERPAQCCRHRDRHCERDRSEVAELCRRRCCRAGFVCKIPLRKFPAFFFSLLLTKAAALKSVKRVLNHLSDTCFYWISSFFILK